MSEHPQRAATDEMADWYERQLRPKLARAAREQTISPAAAIQLEMQMTRLLRTRPPRRRRENRLLEVS